MFNPLFVKKGQVYICDFELCSKKCEYKCEGTANIKPEIGKKRPVVIVKAHKRYRMALIIPLTTQKPLKETAWITYIPKNILKGVLADKECWALCDMITLVSLERLELIYTGHSANFEKNKTSRLENQYFNEILEKLRKMF